MTAPRRVALIGAGSIADVHAEALRALPDTHVVAVVDRDAGRAERFARRWKIDRAFGDVDALLAHDAFDAAHVLTPPDRHADAALPVLRAGYDVLVEKPAATNATECRSLLDAAEAGHAQLGVNQNFLFHPAFRPLRDLARSGELGPLQHVQCHYNMPLRQLAARQFSHWMFERPQNILLEQAVHPLSQIVDLAGFMLEGQATTGAVTELSPGRLFYGRWMATLRLERATAQVYFGFGADQPAWALTAIFADGVVQADIHRNWVQVQTKTRWPDFWDNYLNGRAAARAVARAGRAGAADYLLSTLKLKGRSDPFYLSMRDSVAAWHAGTSPADGRFGAELVRICEHLAGPHLLDRPAAPAVRREATNGYDVAVLGGTGFIGTPTVKALLGHGLRVGVMARNTRNLPPPFDDPRVTVLSGSISDAAAVERAIGPARSVVNLAHGGGGATAAEIEAALVGGARTVAEACLRRGVDRLVHVGSIAALYLGDPDATVTGSTPVDERPDQRAPYARAKAIADKLLLEMHRAQGLPVVILRPGVVVGEGGSPLHSGLGVFNRDRHCLGWNGGDNPLPFVLVEDVASAILAALTAPGAVGRSYNLVGDVRLSARDYMAELRTATGRPFEFHPQSPILVEAVEIAKWAVKAATGRKENPFPTWRDLTSRGLVARFDCSDAKRDLGWAPVADRETFVRRAIAVHAGAPSP